jgi:hypothetical protein
VKLIEAIDTVVVKVLFSIEKGGEPMIYKVFGTLKHPKIIKTYEVIETVIYNEPLESQI